MANPMRGSRNVTSSPNRRTRRLDPQRSQKIADATWSLLARHGYDGLTFEAIASAVGCNRATIYRRHASKAALVRAVMLETVWSIAPTFDETVSPRQALFELVMIGLQYMGGERGAAMLNVAAVAMTSPELAEVLDSHLSGVAPFYVAQFRRIAPDAPQETIDFALHTLIGSFLYHLTFRRGGLSKSQVESLVDQAMALVGA